MLRLIADGNSYSEEQLAQTLNIPCTTIKNIINSLSDYGLMVIKTTDETYRLSNAIDFLDRAFLLSKLQPIIQKNIDELEIFEEIDSTNQYLLNHSNITVNQISIALAEYQTQGRGRHGNAWLSPLGAGINLSIRWCLEQAIAPIDDLSTVIGTTVIRTLARIGFNNLILKRPNDIFFQKKKLGGMLIETKGEKPYYLIIGLGLNIRLPESFKNKIDQPCTDLAAIKKTLPSRNDIAAQLISAMIITLKDYTNDNNDLFISPKG